MRFVTDFRIPKCGSYQQEHHVMPAPIHNFDHLKPRAAAAPLDPSARRGQFDHLNDGGPPVVSASQILAAAAKARTPTGTGAARPTGAAAAILAAGAKRRGQA